MRTYEIRTFGCQMNKHDSERIAGLLRAHGLEPAAPDDSPDVVVFNTCCVRENADERLYGQVSSLRALKLKNPDTLIAVGGCIGQRDGVSVVSKVPHVDVVFGTHNIARLPALLDAAAASRHAQVDIGESAGGDLTSHLPTEREHPWHAWVPITVGCDNFCTYCVVPYVRGRERSRRMEDILAEVRQLAADGVVEVTLLGQNVNSYGRDLYGEPRFAQLVAAVAEAGPEWVRFTTSHPKDLSDSTIAAMADSPRVCRHLHLPLQSGSDRILQAMNRRYAQRDYLALVERLYAAMPDLALSTDVIVGFPGETNEDFEATLRVVKACRYDQAFTFIYSPRVGTPAASMEGRVDRAVVQERFNRLVKTIHASALAKNQLLLGTTQRILLEGGSKRDERMLSGRTATNKVIHIPVPEGHSAAEFAGTFADAEIVDAQTWFLLGETRG